MEDWAEVRRLHRADKMPIKATVRHLGLSRNYGARCAALRADRPPHHERAPAGSIVDAVELQMRELLREIRRCRRL